MRPSGLGLLDVDTNLLDEALLAVRVTAAIGLLLFPDEKLFEEVTGLGILDFFT